MTKIEPYLDKLVAAADGLQSILQKEQQALAGHDVVAMEAILADKLTHLDYFASLEKELEAAVQRAGMGDNGMQSLMTMHNQGSAQHTTMNRKISQLVKLLSMCKKMTQENHNLTQQGMLHISRSLKVLQSGKADNASQVYQQSGICEPEAMPGRTISIV